MTDIETVAIRQTSDQLAEDTNGFWFWQAAVGGYMIEQFAAFHILEDKVSADNCKP